MLPLTFSSESLQTLTTPIPADQKNLAFGYTNALLDFVAELGQPILHFWEMTPTVILGLKDKRLPDLPAAIRAVQAHGYNWVLRNSGGLAVVADAGVLNVSLFSPLTSPPVSVDAAYAQMMALVRQAWPELTIDHFEVTRSYCPGDYDLSVNGQKIAGLSQRRNPHAMVTMLYLSVDGDQTSRGRLVQDFYRAGLAGHPNQWGFPDVDPAVMTTTAALLQHPVTLADARQRFITASEATGVRVSQAKLASLITQPRFTTALTHATAQMARRQPNLNL
ncbi:lipoate--protein ligase family protein [Levilactobacillus acidifarinae]|uniref:Lipoate-protein ligase A n=1 Tax=Levilactobacillus acidifarinae DSM 19394 = JCM 15949 TaxID=1423715 RepID=A0A0R1LTJ6_9LACO|nr:lipoate--protein ligase family protein [Levilactobacillus acidifarinae]KRK95506.1 lipoate-protein ligase A [Levilactobacillus acidifarinae DSM 19394]GEO70249.1 lipoate--protein ligase A [Levilactobacillus acidifarinae]